MNTLRAQLIFPSKPSFQQQNPVKNQYLPHLISESCEINSIKSYLLAFQQQQEVPQISIQFSVSILFSFHWKNGSIINNFHTVAPKSVKPSQCTPTHSLRAFQRYQERGMKRHNLKDQKPQNSFKLFLNITSISLLD
jgi:hypothetical protein